MGGFKGGRDVRKNSGPRVVCPRVVDGRVKGLNGSVKSRRISRAGSPRRKVRNGAK